MTKIFYIFYLLFLLIVIVGVSVYTHQEMSHARSLIELKQNFCETYNATYMDFNKTDYCYVKLPNGLVLIEIEEVCFNEFEPCTFKLKGEV